MIGVISKQSEFPVVQEFFQLFKTPWEQFRPGNSYDVLIVCDGEVPETAAKLVVVYGYGTKRIDCSLGVRTGEISNKACTLTAGDVSLPIYGQLAVFEEGLAVQVCLRNNVGIAGVQIRRRGQIIYRLGYELFEEIRHLLSVGQPVANAHIPTLELHIHFLREWMIEAGIKFIEIPPSPHGKRFSVCLTHDIDFVGIKHHRLDHTMFGFLYRSTIGAAGQYWRQSISLERAFKMWKAAASLPLVHLGLAKDFWIPFEWYLKVEKGLNPTYFLIPFKNVAGKKVSAPNPSRRASIYGIKDIPHWSGKLIEENCEIGVHGLDAWHDVESGRREREEIECVTGKPETGIRMHWLLRDETTNRTLEEAGYSYDSTVGYNETVGYRAGTTQVFKPLEVQRLLELPLHIQDGALFFPGRLGLKEKEAWKLCEGVIQNGERFGGVITILWHDRSHGPERFWGDFYRELVEHLKLMPVWFASAKRIVQWFRRRRQVSFERIDSDGVEGVKVRCTGQSIGTPMSIRIHNSPGTVDHRWDGEMSVEIDEFFPTSRPAAVPASRPNLEAFAAS